MSLSSRLCAGNVSEHTSGHLVAAGMAARKSGKIINIGSMYSIFGSSLVPSYSAAKGGVIQLTKSMAIELAEYNIQVNAILPGWISTDMTADIEASEMGAAPAGLWPAVGLQYRHMQSGV